MCVCVVLCVFFVCCVLYVFGDPVVDSVCVCVRLCLYVFWYSNGW